VVVGIMLAVLRSGRLSRKVAALAAVMVLGALAAGVVVIAARGGQGGEDLRLELWRTALAVLAAHAVLGGGPDTWALLKLAEAQPGVTTLVVAHAHNVALWTLAELGIVGTAGVLVLAGAILVRLARRVADRDLATSAAAIGALAALAGVAAQSLVDVVTNLPSVVVLLALVLALALADEEDPHGSSQPSGRLRVAVGIAGVGVALLGISLVRVDIAMETASTGRMLLEYDPPAAQVRFAAAYDMDPNPLYRHEQALAAAFAGDLATASDLTDALVAEDGLAHHLVLQGYQRAAAGDRDGAAASAWLALDRGGSDPGVVLNVARIGELAGDGALARDALVLAAARAPETLDDPFWRSPDRALPYPELIREAAAAVAPGDPGAAAQILLVGGDPTAGAALDALPPGQREAAMALAGWREDPEAAISHLEARLEADPKDWVAAARLAWIASGVGRREEARRYARWAVIVQGDAASGIYSPPRSVGDAYGLPQFRLGGQYPDPVYKQQGSGLLFGPGSVTLIP
jgi:tetratricopeptide (TPR) repeat protein